MSLRDDLFAKHKRPAVVAAVPTPEWPEADGKVFVRKLTAGELDKYYASDGNERARFVCLVACDEAGERLFRDADAADVAEMAFEVIDRIAYRGQEFNRMLPGQREELLKNSAGGGGDGSPTTSPAP